MTYREYRSAVSGDRLSVQQIAQHSLAFPLGNETLKTGKYYLLKSLDELSVTSDQHENLKTIQRLFTLLEQATKHTLMPSLRNEIVAHKMNPLSDNDDSPLG